MTPQEQESLPLWRWQFVTPAVAAVAGLMAVLVAAWTVYSRDASTAPTATARPGVTQVAPPTAVPSVTASGSPTTASGLAPSDVLLGRDVKPDREDACRVPGLGTGAAWLPSAMRLGGKDYEAGYYCNLVAGGTGALTFSPSRAYRRLRTSIGFIDGSGSGSRSVRFEVIGDDRVYLVEPRTLRFGESADLDIDVSGITRLKLQVTELSPAGGSGSPAQPAFALLALSPN